MPLLYELSDDPQQAIDEIHAYCSAPRGADDPGNPRDRLLALVSALLVDDDYVDPQVTERLARLHRTLPEDDHDVLGPLGLYLCLSSALACALSPEPSEELLAEARAHFGEGPVKQCFGAFYGLGEGYDL